MVSLMRAVTTFPRAHVKAIDLLIGPSQPGPSQKLRQLQLQQQAGISLKRALMQALYYLWPAKPTHILYSSAAAGR